MAAYNLVPPTSRGFQEARAAKARLLLGRSGSNLADLSDAWDSLNDAQLDPQTTAQLQTQILEAAIPYAAANRFRVTQTFAGRPATLRNLRTLQEAAFQELAKWASNDGDRRRYLGQADSVRSWSLL